MPIRVPDELPAVNFLREENVFVMTTSRASGQEIRPLKVLILNLMPKKIETENQFLRLLSNSPLQVDIQLLRIDSRESRNTPAEHLNNFYCNFEDIQEQMLKAKKEGISYDQAGIKAEINLSDFIEPVRKEVYEELQSSGWAVYVGISPGNTIIKPY